MLKQQFQPPTQISVLPNLVIIGAMKCGTSSLHNYLALHPQIHMSSTKELNFFVEDKNWQRGLAWYKSNFTNPADVVGESSPMYSVYPAVQGVPARMHSIIPNTKLIYIVRDPIKRIISHYILNVTDGREKRSFSAVLTNLKTNHYVRCSKYYMQLEQFLDYYPPSSILVISLEELARERINTLSKVFSFLQVDPSFEHENFFVTVNESGKRGQLTTLGRQLKQLKTFIPGLKNSSDQGGWDFGSATRMRRLLSSVMPQLIERPVEQPILSEYLRQELVDVLRDDVEKLRAFTGCAFAEWSL